MMNTYLLTYESAQQLGKMRMSIPCRSHQCDHLQCFDAITFLQMNERKPTWFCPVCDRNADFNRLIIDGFVALQPFHVLKLSWNVYHF